MFKNREWFLGKRRGIRGRGRISRIYAIHKCIYVGSFIQIGQWESVKKNREIGFKRRGIISKEKKISRNFHPKMNVSRKFHSNRTIGICSKIGETFWEFGGILREENAKLTNVTLK